MAIIRYVTADITVVTSTNGTVTVDGSDTYIVWNTSGTFEFTLAAAGPANLKSLDTNVKSNIKSYNTNVLANIKSINTNA